VDLLLHLKQVIRPVDLLLHLKQVIRPVDLLLDLKQVIHPVDLLLDLKHVIQPFHPPPDSPVASPLDLLLLGQKLILPVISLLKGPVAFLPDLLVGERKVINQVEPLVDVLVVVLKRSISMVDLLQAFLPHHLVDLQAAYNKLVDPPVVNSPPGLWEEEPYLDSPVVDLKEQDVSRVELEVVPVAFQAQVFYLVTKVVPRKAHITKAIILLFLVSLAPTTPFMPRFH
jgi:hypothetical protein